MTIFKKSTYQWWQLAELKWSAFLVGIAIGSYWSNIFAPFALILAIIGIIFGLYIATVWYKQ